MRAIIPILALLSLILAPVSMAFAGDEPNGDDAGQAASDHDDGDRNQAIREAWGEVFAAPDDHRWEIDAGLGRMSWQNAYSGFDAQPYLHLRGRSLLAGPLTVSLAIDHTWQRNDVSVITFDSRRFGMLAGVGLHHWQGRWLVGTEAQVGANYERRSVEDATGSSADGRFQPLGGLVGRAGISLFGTASFSLELGIRAHPDGLDRHYGVQLGWLL